jgi:hypothetical protein
MYEYENIILWACSIDFPSFKNVDLWKLYPYDAMIRKGI